ncbi:MAG: aminotransferase class III-fold pyridoxal phosphate-dependent enzyme, partial [Alteraurantiacibacter sp.]
PFPVEGAEQATMDALEAAFTAGETAAFIVEPLVLGAGGMLMYPPETLREMHAICARHGVLFIADEVMTGWGRTGTLTASEQAGVVPDIMCLAKGLTGGSMPLAVTMASAPIYDAHFSTDRARMFFHSSSFTANPIACAAANANLAIWREEPVLERIAALTTRNGEGIQTLAKKHGLANVRQCGTIVAADVPVGDAGYLAELGPRMREGFYARDILLRPLGNTIYLMPPYSITEGQLDRVFSAVDEVLSDLV